MPASGSGVSFRYLAETSYGTTPASAMTGMRFQTHDIGAVRDTFRAEETVSDRQNTDTITTGWRGEGTINTLLEYGNADEFISSAMFADWGSNATITATTIAATGTGFTDSGNGFDFTVGQYISATGFSGSTINTVYRVTAAAAGSLTTSPAPPTTESAGQTVTLQGSLISNGSTQQSMSIEWDYGDLSSPIFMSMKGTVVDTMTLSYGFGQPVNLNFGVLGRKPVAGTATIGTGTASAAVTSPAINSVGNVVRTSEGSTAQARVRAATLSIANGLRSRGVVGSTDPDSIGAGNCSVSGSITVYLNDDTLLDKFLDETDSALEFVFQDSNGDGYGFYLPNVSYTSGPTPAPGPTSDVELVLGFNADKDSTTGKTIMISRYT